MRLFCILMAFVLFTACGESGGAASSAEDDFQTPSESKKNGNAKKISVSAQGQTDSGVSVRVKSVEFGEDVTMLDVSMSFSNNMGGSSILMAFGNTFIVDEAGNRLPLRRPDENKELKIKNNDMLNDRLVFMGGISPASRKITLVFNSGMEGSGGIAWPELIIEIPLKGN